MVNISIDLAKDQISFVQSLVDRGIYGSRSETVRDALRRAEFEWKWREGLEEAKNKHISEDIRAERRAVSKKLLEKFLDVKD